MNSVFDFLRHRVGLIVWLPTMILTIQQPASQCKADDIRRPDLIIQRMYLVKYTDECFVAVRIKNRGTGRVPDSVWTNHNPKSAGIYFYRNGKGWGGTSIWRLDPGKFLQKPGGSVSHTSKLEVSGAVKVRAVIDLWNTLAEENKDNNSRTKEFREGDCESTPSQAELLM